MKNKYLWIVGVLVILLAVVVFMVMKNQSAKTNSTAYNTETTTSQTPTEDSAMTKDTPVTPAAKSNNISYNDALKKYGTNRIQIQQSCQAVPNNVVYKNGTTIMLDNRASITHVIKIDSKTYTIKAYDYTTVKLSSSTLPHTVLMDCDKSQNVATILIQK